MKTYLQILELEKKKPSLDYLRALVAAQLIHFPYESVSKGVQVARGDTDFPSREEYLAHCRDFGYGGTCYVQNGYFRELLDDLGFRTEILTASVDGQVGHHLGCRVLLGDTSYVIDFGFMDAFTGPFDENGPMVERVLGGRRFKFLPLGEGKFRFEVFKDGVLQRYFDDVKTIATLDEMKNSIAESYRTSAFFMQNFVIGRRCGDPCINVFNDETIVTRGEMVEKRKLANVAELARYVHREMKLPRYPVEKAVEAINANRASHSVPPLW